MKKFTKTLALFLFCVAAMSGNAFADVAVMPMIVTIGLIYVLVAAVAVIAIVLVIKLVRSIARNKRK